MIGLSVDGAAVAVDHDHGARVASLLVDGLELLVTEAERPDWYGAFVMAPWAGRTRHGRFSTGGEQHQLEVGADGHARHGTVLDRPFEVLEHEHALLTPPGSDERAQRATQGWSQRMFVRLGRDLQPGWPWPGRVEHSVALFADRLELRLEVHAERTAFPAACGWHPWFRRQLDRGQPAEVDLDAEWLWQRDAESIPTGELVHPPADGPFDDCFSGLRRPPVVRWPGALAVTVESPCEYVVFFDEMAHAVCVEPQTGPPDALNLASVLVEPGAPLVATATFRWSPA